MEQAEVSNCDVFIAMTDKDEVNMISAVLAKQMGAKETIVRVRNPEYSNAYFKDKTVFALSPFAYSSFTSSPTLYLMISIKSTTDTSKISSDPSSIM